MSLYTNLKNARTEEDVKDIYIKALGLKQYTKGLVDTFRTCEEKRQLILGMHLSMRIWQRT